MRMRTTVSWSVRVRSGPSPAPDAAELPPDHVLASAERRPPQRGYPRLACYAVLLCRLASLSPPNSRKFLQRTYKNKGLDAPALLQKRSRKPLTLHGVPGFESLSLRHLPLFSKVKRQSAHILVGASTTQITPGFGRLFPRPGSAPQAQCDICSDREANVPDAAKLRVAGQRCRQTDPGKVSALRGSGVSG